MRVALDGRSFRVANAGRGVSVYLDCLLAELRSAHTGDRFEPVVDRRLQRLAAAAFRRPRLDRLAGGCDVLWLPAPAPFAASDTVPVVLTLHDMSFEHRPSDYTRYERAWHLATRPRRLARAATRVIAVSESVRAQALAEWGLDPARVTTVLSGPGRPPRAAGRLPAGLEPGFVLAVGALEPRKRPDLLIEAYGRARERGLRAELLFAGRGEPPASVSGAREEGSRFLGYVDEPTLEALYRAALVLACPSREEGFGFTPLEAAARGTPAVVAALGPFGETLGDAALAVTPGDAEALADALLRLEREPELRDRLAAAARDAAERLSWKRAARETHAVLAAAAEERA